MSISYNHARNDNGIYRFPMFFNIICQEIEFKKLYFIYDTVWTTLKLVIRL